MTMNRSIIALILIFSSCSGTSNQVSTQVWQQIPARDDGTSLYRPLLYRALVPVSWQRKDPAPNSSIADTTLANCEYSIEEDDEKIRIAVHTFPYQDEGRRIPPQAQVARWKNQLEPLDLLSVKISSEAHGGFVGLFFEGTGSLNGIPASVLGWSMRLAPPYSQQLGWDKHPQDLAKRADYTIKATGPPSLVEKHRGAIVAFANSFELNDELPAP